MTELVDRSSDQASAQPDGRPGPGLVDVVARRVVPLALLLGTFAVLAQLASRPLSNGDTFFHLRFGREFLSGDWSLRSPGSVTDLGTATWVPTQWLAQVLMAQVESWFGLAGVAWLSGLQFIALALTVYLVARRWADPVVAAPLTMIVVVGSASGLSMRPQVVSYVLLAVTAAAWLAARETLKVPWLLVPMTWLWATYHGMWPVGLAVGVVACVGLRLDATFTGTRWARAVAVPVLSAVAAGITPVGPALYGAVLSVNGRGKYFSEWAAPQFTAPNCAAVLAVLGVTVVIMARAGSVSWTPLLLLVLAGGCAVYSLRTVPAAAAIAAPVAAVALQSILGPRTRPGRGERLLVWGGAAATLVVLALVVPRTADRPLATPGWVDPTLSALPSGTRIVNDTNYGGYLMWAHPDLDVVMSGYGDIYTDQQLDDQSTLEHADAGWIEVLRATGARVALLPPSSVLAYNLELQGWTVTREAPEVELLEAPATW